MLRNLAINNIVLIEKARIDFASGLCILTGETGSGKSILLDALGLAIGFRSNLRLIAEGEGQAQVSAEFEISRNENCQKILEENNLLDAENPHCLRIRRVIAENSASKVFVNDEQIGVNLLAKIGETLVEIHGQHDQRGLLNVGTHREILDEFSGNQNLLKNLRKTYENLRAVDEKISDLAAKKEQAVREKDYLQHVVRELENADLKVGEEDELLAKKDRLNGKEKILNFLGDFKNNLLEASSNLFLAQKVFLRSQNFLNNFLANEQENFEQISSKIDRQTDEIESIISNLDDLAKTFGNEEETLSEVEERLFFIRSLARKFNTQIDELPKIILDAQEKLRLLAGEEKSSHDLANERLALLAEYQKIAEELNSRRKKFAKILSQKVESELQFLKMENAKFEIEILPTTDYRLPTTVRFTASLNKNSFDDISKIASGGELSRFMLALKVALMDVHSTPTMIFDEIDTGIGGSTADAVGKRLKILSEKLQIFVVTHQAQIAAKANSHFKISKISDGKKVKTVIEKLDEKSRETEIARMLSGEEISKEALAAAKKLINHNNA